jgi:hypothetical protein
MTNAGNQQMSGNYEFDQTLFEKRTPTMMAAGRVHIPHRKFIEEQFLDAALTSASGLSLQLKPAEPQPEPVFAK